MAAPTRDTRFVSLLLRRRFKPSQLRTNDFAQNPYHATAPKPVCMQANRTANEVMSEDCLFLNIYTPLKPNTARASPPKAEIRVPLQRIRTR